MFKRKLRKKLSEEAIGALSALHSNDKKPLKDMIEWTALDCFRMRKAEEVGGTLTITVQEFQIKEVR